MQVLVVGDLHLHDDHSPVTVPDSWNEYDAIILVGDLLDARATTTAPADRFLSQLAVRAPPVLAVPGNHDYQRFQELVADYESIHNLHQTSHQLNGYSFYGQGATQFDAGPAVRYPHTDAFDTDSYHDLRRAIDRAARPHTTTHPSSSGVHTQLSAYRARLRALANTANGCTQPRILVSHLPPFNSRLDTLAPTHPRYPNKPWGSLAIRTHLETHTVTAVLSGHIHEAAGTTTIGDTACLNAGLDTSYTATFATTTDPVITHNSTLD